MLSRWLTRLTSNSHHQEADPQILVFGLPAAIARESEGFSRWFLIECDYTAELIEDRFTVSGATQVFRILQESLANVARQGRAATVAIDLREQGDDLVLKVVDDGTVMTKTPPGETPGELQSIHERAHRLGGKVMVTTAAGGGVRIQARIPMESVLEKMARVRVAQRQKSSGLHLGGVRRALAGIG